MNHIAFVHKLSSVLICVQTSSLDFKVLGPGEDHSDISRHSQVYVARNGATTG